MNPTPDTTTSAGNGGNFDPQQAAALLDQTTQRARRRLAPSPPWLLATRGVAVLIALGAIWLSVRGQHPYQGPTAADIPILIAFVVLNFAATVAVRERATRRDTRQNPAAPGRDHHPGGVLGRRARAHVGTVRRRGELRPVPAPRSLIVPGLAYAAVMAAREDWRGCGEGLAVAAVGVVGAFAGPAGSWAVTGVGLCARAGGQGRRRRPAGSAHDGVP